MPWQRRFFDWAFNLDEPQLAEKYAMIPADTDVIISHGPPKGYGDSVMPRVFQEEGWPKLIQVGSPSLTQKIEEIKPKLVVYGHIHQGYGSYTYYHFFTEGKPVSKLINASYVDETYKHTDKHPIQVVEI